MTETRAVAMDDAEIREFLGTGGTGVLSLAREDEPYAVPLSYGFDPSGPALYVRLGYGPDSEKRAFLAGPARVAFVVYRETDEGWKSVVARGRLEEVTEAALDSSVSDAIHAIDVPFVDIYDRHPREVEFTLGRIAVEELTGRAEATA